MYPGYHNTVNTSTGGWAVTDKIFGYLSSLTMDYSSVKNSTLNPLDPNYAQQQAAQNIGILGLQKPLGSIIIIGVIGLIVFGVYKAVK
jgi:hypothetical protein